MRKVILTFKLLVFSGIAIAQVAFPRFQTKPVIAGVNPGGDSIVGLSIDLSPFTVADYTYDSSSGRLYLDMLTTKINGNWDNRNYYTCFDLKKKKVIWNSSFKQYSPAAFFMGDNIARHMGAYCGVYDATTRELLGKDPEDWIVYADRKHGYFLSQNGMAMDGITLKELWDADINAKYGWSDLRYISNDTILIVANGLYAINVKTGKGWQHKLKTGTDKYGNMIALNAIGLTAAVFTGVGVYGGAPDKFTGMCSNLLEAEDAWYFAGAGEIIKVWRNGDLAWKVLLPENHSGKSEIWLQGDSLFVLNRGYAIKANKIMPVDKPYMATYSIKDGKMLYNLPLHDKGIVQSTMIDENKLYLRFEKAITVYDILSAKAIADTEITDTLKDYSIWFPGDEIALKNNKGEIAQYNDLKRQNVLLQNKSDGRILVLNETLETINSIEWGDYYLTRHRLGYTYQITKGGSQVFEGNELKGEIKEGFIPSFKNGKEFVTIDNNKLYFYTMSR